MIQKIDSLKSELDKLLPMKAEDQQRLDKKFRLEWNYNSNHIEGNTLTYGQTELLIMFGKTTGDHDIREYQEMKAHDAALILVKEYANDKTRHLSEADIRELNRMILVEPYYGVAWTEDGQQTRKLIQPGVYKKEPNSVRLQNGEMFHYASPDETPIKMAELMDWFRKVESEKKLHPIQIAAQLHYDFVRIHPFDDSNGRTSRLLMNYVLLRSDLPPVIVKSSDKRNYLIALNKADAGDLEPFIEYIAKELVWSLEISIRAAKSDSIEEKDDLYKEIEIWEKSIKKTDIERPVKNVEFIKEFFLVSLMPFFEELASRYSQFNKLFVSSQIYVSEPGSTALVKTIDDIKDYFWNKISNYERNKVGFDVDYQTWTIQFNYFIFKSNLDKKLYFNSSVVIEFHPLQIEIKNGDSKKILKKLYYSDSTDSLVASEIVKASLSEDFQRLKLLQTHAQ